MVFRKQVDIEHKKRELLRETADRISNATTQWKNETPTPPVQTNSEPSEKSSHFSGSIKELPDVIKGEQDPEEAQREEELGERYFNHAYARFNNFF